MCADLPIVLDLHENQIEEIDQQFINASINQVHPIIQKWGALATKAELREEQRNTIRSLVDENVARQLAGAMCISKLPSGSLKSRLIEIEGHRLIASIQFQDTADKAPFVCFSRATFPLGTMSDWSRLKRGLSRLFAEFKPEVGLFFHPCHLPLNARTSGIDDHLLVAPARLIANMPKTAELERVNIKRSLNLDFYPRYKAIYEATYLERPTLRSYVRTETEASLAHCLNKGFLFEIAVDGEWAGIVAGKWRTLVGVRGVFMVEIVLTKEARGQRLGPVVHRLFATAVEAEEPDAVITGTISEKNTWSLQTALRAGRTEIGAWHWVRL